MKNNILTGASALALAIGVPASAQNVSDIDQSGVDHGADVTQTGSNNISDVDQTNQFNEAVVLQSGSNAQSTINQSGNGENSDRANR
ncbi:MAG TPA: hypothetical protein DIW45_10145, partial [Erythrobacter sp.]|nr:hypothetical protein [Erythrobacter sp.]